MRRKAPRRMSGFLIARKRLAADTILVRPVRCGPSERAALWWRSGLAVRRERCLAHVGAERSFPDLRAPLSFVLFEMTTNQVYLLTRTAAPRVVAADAFRCRATGVIEVE